MPYYLLGVNTGTKTQPWILRLALARSVVSGWMKSSVIPKHSLLLIELLTRCVLFFSATVR